MSYRQWFSGIDSICIASSVFLRTVQAHQADEPANASWQVTLGRRQVMQVRSSVKAGIGVFNNA